jgi:hypothetical protein
MLHVLQSDVDEVEAECTSSKVTGCGQREGRGPTSDHCPLPTGRVLSAKVQCEYQYRGTTICKHSTIWFYKVQVLVQYRTHITHPHRVCIFSWATKSQSTLPVNTCTGTVQYTVLVTCTTREQNTGNAGCRRNAWTILQLATIENNRNASPGTVATSTIARQVL